MTISLGATEISDLKLGNTQVSKVCLGNTEVWSNTPPTPTVIRALKFECAESQTLGIYVGNLGSISPNFEYSTNGVSWTSWSDLSSPLSFGNGVDLYIRGSNELLSNATHSTQFVFSQSNNKVTCSGNVMHLFDYTQDLTAFPAEPTSYGISYLFSGCTALAVPPSLPAITLIPYCYTSMFQNCTSLTAIPALPATTLDTNCYRYMFVNCTSVKMSTTQSESYPNEFVFGTNPSGYTYRMFRGTGGSYTGAPDQTTYYTANTIIY